MKRKVDEYDSERQGAIFTLALIALTVLLPVGFVLYASSQAMTAVSESVTVSSSVSSSISSSSSSSFAVVAATEELPSVPLTTEVECGADALIAAIDAANARPGLDTLNLRTDCIYTLEGVHNTRSGLNGLPIVKEDLTLVGHGGTFIERGDDTTRFRFFYVEGDANLTLENLTLRGVRTRPSTPTPEPEINFDDEPDLSFMPDAYEGGAIYTYSGLIRLHEVTLYGFVTAGGGGAIYSYEGDVLVTDSVIHDNIAGGDGGAIYSYSGNVTVVGGEIHHNRSLSSGGGIYTYSGFIMATGSRVYHNRSSDRGGGLYTYKGAMTLRGIVVENNAARSAGGGLYSYEGLIDAQDIMVVNNTAGFDGGGIFTYNANLIIDSEGVSTISGNHAGGNGGGLWFYLGRVILNTATISDNSANRGGGIWVYAGSVSLLEANLRDNTAVREDDNLWSYINATIDYEIPSRPLATPTP